MTEKCCQPLGLGALRLPTTPVDCQGVSGGALLSRIAGIPAPFPPSAGGVIDPETLGKLLTVLGGSLAGQPERCPLLTTRLHVFVAVDAGHLGPVPAGR